MKIKEMSKKELLEYHKNKMREWRKRNRERDLELKKKWRDNNKEHRNNYFKEYEKRPDVRKRRREYYQKYPEKYKQSKKYIRNYMREYYQDISKREKFLQRQKDYSKFRKCLLNIYKVCQECSSKENLEIHHLTYNTPTIKDLIILCRKCHKALHRKENNTEV